MKTIEQETGVIPIIGDQVPKSEEKGHQRKSSFRSPVTARRASQVLLSLSLLLFQKDS